MLNKGACCAISSFSEGQNHSDAGGSSLLSVGLSFLETASVDTSSDDCVHL
jgi:hypothetical protein